MLKKSAGIILYRWKNNVPEVMLVHPGGPFWKKKDDGVWSIPKGEFNDNEEPQQAAKRELKEETGIEVSGTLIELSPVKLQSKIVFAWAVQQDAVVDEITSNTFEMEWPPKSGKVQSFPEIDRAAWFTFQDARQKINAGQIPLLNELEVLI